jgi:hypothetical protein
MANEGLFVLRSTLTHKFFLCVRHAWDSTKGIRLVAIDRNKLLTEQGPFDVILHKVSAALPYAATFFSFFSHVHLHI